nr:ribonuclease H-like domain-containing protein [Tanacetum cinerariifolium]
MSFNESKTYRTSSALKEPCLLLFAALDPLASRRNFQRDESHRSTQSHNGPKSGSVAFMKRTNNRSNNWSGSNNQTRRLNRPNLVCTHCNMNGHTTDRCFEFVGYPPNFKKNNGTNRSSTSNIAILENKDQYVGSSNSFTNDQYKRLIALISEKSSSSSMPANIADLVIHLIKFLTFSFETNSKMDMCEVFHKAKQTREPFPISNHQTKDLGELVHLDVWGPYKTSCAYTPQHNGIAERKHRHLLNVARTPSPVLSGKSTFEMIFKTKPNLSNLKVFGCLCFSTVLNNIDKFSSSLNKFSEPKTYGEAASDIRWIEAMNQEMEALNRNVQSHLKFAFRVLRYIKNAPGKGISFVKDKELDLSVFVDSDCVTIRYF